MCYSHLLLYIKQDLHIAKCELIDLIYEGIIYNYIAHKEDMEKIFGIIKCVTYYQLNRQNKMTTVRIQTNVSTSSIFSITNTSF